MSYMTSGTSMSAVKDSSEDDVNGTCQMGLQGSCETARKDFLDKINGSNFCFSSALFQ